jgi:transposase
MRWEVSMGRKRRTFSKEFKAETVALLRASDKSVGQIAADLGVGESLLRRWVQQADVDAGSGRSGELTSEEKQELSQLRREVRELRMEREILKKATVRSTGHCNTMRLLSGRRQHGETIEAAINGYRKGRALGTMA